MPKNDFKKVAWHGSSPVNLLRIFRTPFPKNTSGGLPFSMAALFFNENGFLACRMISRFKYQTFSSIFSCFHFLAHRVAEWSFLDLLPTVFKIRSICVEYVDLSFTPKRAIF